MNTVTMINAFVRRVREDEEGVTAIEYAMIAALVAVALVTSLKGLATGLEGTFTTIVSNL
jgi:pilus assembly protein Flp/PilA